MRGVHPIVSRTFSYGRRFRSTEAIYFFVESVGAVSVFLRIVSPGSGGASGCLKYTGNRMDTGTGCPRVFAGMKRRSLEPLTAAESSAGYVELSATCVDS